MRRYCCLLVLFAALAGTAADRSLVSRLQLLVDYAKSTGDVDGCATLCQYFASKAPKEKAIPFRSLARRLKDGSWKEISGAVDHSVDAFGFAATSSTTTTLLQWLVDGVVGELSKRNLQERSQEAAALKGALPSQPVLALASQELTQLQKTERLREALSLQANTVAGKLAKLRTRLNAGDMSVAVLRSIETAETDLKAVNAKLKELPYRTELITALRERVAKQLAEGAQ